MTGNCGHYNKTKSIHKDVFMKKINFGQICYWKVQIDIDMLVTLKRFNKRVKTSIIMVNFYHK